MTNVELEMAAQRPLKSGPTCRHSCDKMVFKAASPHSSVFHLTSLYRNHSVSGIQNHDGYIQPPNVELPLAARRL